MRENTRNAGSDMENMLKKYWYINCPRRQRTIIGSRISTGYDPRERWWGIELEFPAINNKQVQHDFPTSHEIRLFLKKHKRYWPSS